MNILSATAPTWANAAQTAINLAVTFEGLSGAIPFTAMPDDAEQHGRDLYTRAVALEFGAIGAFVPRAAPVVTTVTMKQCRLALLAAGILPQVTAAISSMPMAAQISWEFSQTVLKTDPLVQQLAVAFGLNLDTLFAAAAAL